MGFVVLLTMLLLVGAAVYYGKPFVDRHFMLRAHPKKREGEPEHASVQIVVDHGTPAANSGVATEERRKSAPAVPSRLARQQLGSPLNVEASIRTALRDLRSRQVVKTLCSKFESQMSKNRTSAGESAQVDTVRAVQDNIRAVQYQPLLVSSDDIVESATSEAAPPSPVQVDTLLPPRRDSNTNTARPNNLSAFLSRYSSNLEKAAKVMQMAATDAVTDAVDRLKIAASKASEDVAEPAADQYDGDEEDDFVNKHEAPAVAYPPIPFADLHLDLEPAITIAAVSNQCDSPDDITDSSSSRQPPGERTEAQYGNNRGSTLVSRIPVPLRSSSRSSFGTEPTTKVTSPEDGDAPLPVASKSMARLQQFRQQIPANGGVHLD